MRIDGWLNSEELANYIARVEGETFVTLVLSKNEEDIRVSFTEVEWSKFIRAMHRIDRWLDEDSV